MMTDPLPPPPPAPGQGQGLASQAGFGASIFLAFAVGYVLSLRTLTFDIVIPSLFLWACLSGIILAGSGVRSLWKITKRCVIVSAAFALSPVMFATLRGTLAVMSGDVPDMTNALGYGVFNFISFGGSLRTICIIYAILFFVSLILLMVSTYAGEWIVLVASKVFFMGSDGVEKINATLLKAGATLGIMGAAIVFVANLNKKEEFITGDEATKLHDISMPAEGFLEITNSEVGLVRGRLFMGDDDVLDTLDILIPKKVAQSIVGDEKTAALLSNPPCENFATEEIDCVDPVRYGRVKLKFSKKLKISISHYLVVSSLEKVSVKKP